MKYDLGGIKNHDGYVSVNLLGSPGIKADILNLDSFCEDESVEEFLMVHTYEHISPIETPSFIKNILKKLKTGGTLKIIHTDIKETLNLYMNGSIDFRALRDIIFVSAYRRINAYKQVGQDVMGHEYMWGAEELIEELIFYGFTFATKFDAGSWGFDFENYFPKDDMLRLHGIKIPNLGVVACKK